MVAVIRRVVQGAREWLTAPEPRIAGRMGLFRMIYAVFYLWHLSWVDGATLGLLPDAVWQPVYLLQVVPLRPPSELPGMLESCLVAALLLLLAGLWVRPVTLAVLLFGTLLEAFQTALVRWSTGASFSFSTYRCSCWAPAGATRGRWMPSWRAARD